MGEKEEITLRLETFNNNEYILADDCINAIGEHRKEIEELKRQIKIKDEYFHLIWMIGCDYDGYKTPKGLKSIIDELVAYANYGAKNDDTYVKDLLELRKDEE